MKGTKNVEKCRVIQYLVIFGFFVLLCVFFGWAGLGWGGGGMGGGAGWGAGRGGGGGSKGGVYHRVFGFSGDVISPHLLYTYTHPTNIFPSTQLHTLYIMYSDTL